MKHFCSSLVCHILPILLLSLAAVRATMVEPSADEIMAKVANRLEQIQSDPNQPAYAFQKMTVTEEIDANGKLKERKEKTYDVLFTSGEFFQKRASQKSSPTEGAFKPAKRTDYMDIFTSDVLQRYKLELTGREAINGRIAYRINFQPKRHNIRSQQHLDRVLDQVAGTLWIDEQEFEVAKAQLYLLGEVSLWGGVAGVLRKSAFILERVRLDGGVWFDRVSLGFFEGRKLFQSGQIRTKTESTDFRRVATERAER